VKGDAVDLMLTVAFKCAGAVVKLSLAVGTRAYRVSIAAHDARAFRRGEPLSEQILGDAR
jgi:hypothetical protein